MFRPSQGKQGSSKSIASLEDAAEAVHNGGKLGERGFEAVSSKDGFQATIRHTRPLLPQEGAGANSPLVSMRLLIICSGCAPRPPISLIAIALYPRI
jgi:hypothetical protein